MLMGIFIYSQAPQKFTYQSIVRSADGSVLRSSDIGLQISILKNSAIGQSVYTETHSARSNANGLVTVVIGDGVSGDNISDCLLYTSPSPRDRSISRMPSSA